MTWPNAVRDPFPTTPSRATLVGRVWVPDVVRPSVVVLRGGRCRRRLGGLPDHARAHGDRRSGRGARLPPRGTAARHRSTTLVANTPPETARRRSAPWLLSPIDLHVVKAAGVTFPVSMLERVIEERARGDQDAAARSAPRSSRRSAVDCDTLRPGSDEAAALKAMLIERGLVEPVPRGRHRPRRRGLHEGARARHGRTRRRRRRAPRLAVEQPRARGRARRRVRRAASSARRLGNDVNLRDIEGRSALLLGKAKDNNASASVGPVHPPVRRRLRPRRRARLGRATVDHGRGRLRLDGVSSRMAQISRDPADLVDQVVGAHHQYPDGFVLYLGTMFAPVDDRDVPGRGLHAPRRRHRVDRGTAARRARQPRALDGGCRAVDVRNRRPLPITDRARTAALTLGEPMLTSTDPRTGAAHHHRPRGDLGRAGRCRGAGRPGGVRGVVHPRPALACRAARRPRRRARRAPRRPRRRRRPRDRARRRPSRRRGRAAAPSSSGCSPRRSATAATSRRRSTTPAQTPLGPAPDIRRMLVPHRPGRGVRIEQLPVRVLGRRRRHGLGARRRQHRRAQGALVAPRDLARSHAVLTGCGGRVRRTRRHHRHRLRHRGRPRARRASARPRRRLHRVARRRPGAARHHQRRVPSRSRSTASSRASTR